MDNFFDHMFDGMSQSERELEALRPSYVKIDERSSEDLLLFLSDIASQFNYYNLQDLPDGDWQDFLQAEMFVVLAEISRLNFVPFQQEYQHIQEQLKQADTDNELHPVLSRFFDLMYGIAILLHNKLAQLKKADTGAHTRVYVDEVLKGLRDDVSLLLQFEDQAVPLFRQTDMFRTDKTDQQLRLTFAGVMQQSKAGSTTFLGLLSLNEVYNNLRAKFYQVSSAAQFYLRTRPDEIRHEPHIGLLMSFIELYKQLQERINGLTGKHLEYYYKKVLGMQERPAIPDKVHVFLETLPQTIPIVIPAGTPMIADARKEIPAATYRLQDAVKVSQARIMTLRSVYISSHKQITAKDHMLQDIIETQVYTATRKVTSPADYMPGMLPVTSWPLMGEEQHQLPAARRTMQETEMGCILASPVLFLPEGKRSVELSLYFEEVSFGKLLSYVENFAAVAGKNKTTVLNELLAPAFIISYTTAEGWETVGWHNIKRGQDNTLIINLQLDVNAPGVATYNPAIHGGSYHTKYPLLKLLLNNNSFHHPYSFMKLLWLERIAIRARVKGYRSVRLYNGTGPLSPSTPFHIFGPQPATGAYLDIRDTNVFNTYTKDFTIKLEWLELPHTVTGFDAHYAEYHADMKNTSFQAAISVFSDGQFIPERSRREKLQLFQTYRDADSRILLSDKTVLQPYDFQKMNFHNKLLLEKEMLVNGDFYTDGVVRLELTSPQEAFGHRLYTRLFPEVVTHNAGRWVKKKPIPNIPYTPLIKSITVDYELEQAEVLKLDKINDADSDMQLFHLYPFGYRQGYPSATQKDFSLLPQFADSASLYIGLKDLQPQEELSLLFQLEEKDSNDTTIQLQKLQWSYLYNDQWLPFDSLHILSDTTQQFINSGIVKLKAPSVNCYGNTRLDADLQWIRLATPVAMNVRPMVKGIFTNAGIAVRDQEDTAVATTLAPMSIKSLQQEIKGIQKVWQLFPSFGGRPAETTMQYYTRVSERLRHKKRAVTNIDLIQLILEAFPEILIVKCINDRDTSLPSDIQLVVVPRQPEAGPYASNEPRASMATLYRIREYAEKLLPPFVQVTVHNPVYEKVKVCCDVCFCKKNAVTDNNYYLSLLQEDIRRYLTPWLFDAASDVKIGNRLYTSEMLNYIKRLPYVEYVTAFSMVHFFQERNKRGELLHCLLDTAISNTGYIKSSTPESVLIPATTHAIRFLDKWQYGDPVPAGISNVMTGEEMVLGQQERTSYGDDPEDHFPEGEIISLTIQPR